jgi:hypothetical protein
LKADWHTYCTVYQLTLALTLPVLLSVYGIRVVMFTVSRGGHSNLENQRRYFDSVNIKLKAQVLKTLEFLKTLRASKWFLCQN